MTGVGVIGTGFMGVAHTEALRRLGVDVVGVVGSSPARARSKASRALLPPVVDSVAELLADRAVDAVHVTSPNHVHAEHVRAVLAAGKHVVCEKPLGISAAETADLLAAADAAGVVHAVCFNIRYYAHNQNAAALVVAGAIGEPRFVTGRYHQDWLLLDTDWNWRLDAARQGGLRAVADIGSHWLDLARFVTGRDVVEVFADLHTFIGERDHPVDDVETFGAAGVGQDVVRVREQVASDDAAGLLLRFADGQRGACTISQVSAGRKNTIEWEVDGSAATLAWASEDPERLWVGHRDRPNEVVEKDRSIMTPAGIAAAAYPAGHVEGYPDSFRALFADIYRDIERGGPSSRPTYPTFADGHDAVLVGEAISASARSGTWAKVDRSRSAIRSASRPIKETAR
ncbi:MAG: Gfo/Idh/MocA family oxidoreductase [Ilumatobacteraceae bacterium]